MGKARYCGSFHGLRPQGLSRAEDGTRPVVLMTLASFLPDRDATGPNQSLRFLRIGLRETFEVRVLACDSSRSDESGWIVDDGGLVQCLSGGWISARGLGRVLRQTPHDVLMLNSFFDYRFSIPLLIMRKIGLIPRRPTIVSPRGEFAAGALSLKSRRKRAWLALVRALGLTRDIWLHATAAHERNDIERLGLLCRGILEAPNASHLGDLPTAPAPRPAGAPLRVASLGRVTPVKNLHYALDVLSQVAHPVHFDIYGPLVDPDYAARLEQQFDKLPDHITARLVGKLPHEEVAQTLAGHDLFFMPTMGENFGHAINEALGSGLPVLISDTTPWRGLVAADAGWDLPLGTPERFVAAIEEMAAMAPHAVARLRAGARALAERNSAASNAIAANQSMISTVLERVEYD